ncbi:uncharacterized protein N7483_011836 [Penicillium malachiteum]|uniref:uncharacterized protein n=1 Tax=Penicillium malachiteum TaxID=1324776 RepID=UPI0025473EF8|nr:uncharacterized protein N7483_011836 [Penicillium malachiteum]KAJ5714655.1 hypothetical protein N7483_011836 [Penicillium malachiteum]
MDDAKCLHALMTFDPKEVKKPTDNQTANISHNPATPVNHGAGTKMPNTEHTPRNKGAQMSNSAEVLDHSVCPMANTLTLDSTQGF